MDVTLEIQSAIASALLRREVRSFMQHLVLLNVNRLAGYAVAQESGRINKVRGH
jgi:hypothetical protein